MPEVLSPTRLKALNPPQNPKELKAARRSHARKPIEASGTKIAQLSEIGHLFKDHPFVQDRSIGPNHSVVQKDLSHSVCSRHRLSLIPTLPLAIRHMCMRHDTCKAVRESSPVCLKASNLLESIQFVRKHPLCARAFSSHDGVNKVKRDTEVYKKWNARPIAANSRALTRHLSPTP